MGCKKFAAPLRAAKKNRRTPMDWKKFAAPLQAAKNSPHHSEFQTPARRTYRHWWPNLTKRNLSLKIRSSGQHYAHPRATDYRLYSQPASSWSNRYKHMELRIPKKTHILAGLATNTFYAAASFSLYALYIAPATAYVTVKSNCSIEQLKTSAKWLSLATEKHTC